MFEIVLVLVLFRITSYLSVISLAVYKFLNLFFQIFKSFFFIKWILYILSYLFSFLYIYFLTYLIFLSIYLSIHLSILCVILSQEKGILFMRILFLSCQPLTSGASALHLHAAKVTAHTYGRYFHFGDIIYLVRPPPQVPKVSIAYKLTSINPGLYLLLTTFYYGLSAFSSFAYVGHKELPFIFSGIQRFHFYLATPWHRGAELFFLPSFFRIF